ncbi:MAG: hypothetical protein ACQGQO_08895 [Sphaerochaetaceae bacterium]
MTDNKEMDFTIILIGILLLVDSAFYSFGWKSGFLFSVSSVPFLIAGYFLGKERWKIGFFLSICSQLIISILFGIGWALRG